MDDQKQDNCKHDWEPLPDFEKTEVNKRTGAIKHIRYRIAQCKKCGMKGHNIVDMDAAIKGQSYRSESGITYGCW